MPLSLDELRKLRGGSSQPQQAQSSSGSLSLDQLRQLRAQAAQPQQDNPAVARAREALALGQQELQVAQQDLASRPKTLADVFRRVPGQAREAIGEQFRQIREDPIREARQFRDFIIQGTKQTLENFQKTKDAIRLRGDLEADERAISARANMNAYLVDRMRKAQQEGNKSELTKLRDTAEKLNADKLVEGIEAREDAPRILNAQGLDKNNLEIFADAVEAGVEVGGLLLGGGIFTQGAKGAGKAGIAGITRAGLRNIGGEAVLGGIEAGTGAFSEGASLEDTAKATAIGAVAAPAAATGLEALGLAAGKATRAVRGAPAEETAEAITRGQVRAQKAAQPTPEPKVTEAAQPEPKTRGQIKQEKVARAEPKVEEKVTTRGEVKTKRAEAKEIKPKKTEEVTVPRSQLPVDTRGQVKQKKKVSRLAERTTRKLEGFKESDVAELPTFNQVNRKDQIRKAAEFVETDPKKAMAVLKGDEPAPEGLLHSSVYLALEQKAIGSKDSKLILDLASLRATRAGQEISMLAERDINSPIKHIQDVKNERIKIKGGDERVKPKIRKEKKAIKDAIKKNKPTAKDWSSFVEEIKCR